MVEGCKMWGNGYKGGEWSDHANLQLDNIIYAKEGNLQRDILLVSAAALNYIETFRKNKQ